MYIYTVCIYNMKQIDLFIDSNLLIFLTEKGLYDQPFIF